MEKKEKYLVNKYIKIRNPHLLHRQSICHECNSDDFDFKTQQKNYDNLKSSFEPFGITFTKVYSTRWSTCDEPQNPNRYVFVVESNSPVVWYKYEGDSYGSGQNYIYFGKKKIKMTQWLNGSPETKTILINQMIQNLVN